MCLSSFITGLSIILRCGYYIIKMNNYVVNGTRRVVSAVCALFFVVSLSGVSHGIYFTWMTGNSHLGETPLGVYGEIGETASNLSPGGRENAVSWVTSNGDLYVLGGQGYGETSSGYLSDFWRFNAATKQWTFVGGTSELNKSGVYGTRGMGGALTFPGSRINAVGITDKYDNLWLFGGYGYDKNGNLGELSDLWFYNRAANLWSWMSGKDVVNSNGNYGVKTVPAADNLPSGRQSATIWYDRENHAIYVFGGYGLPAIGTSKGRLNDVWKFNILTQQWSWEHGANSINSDGLYGSLGEFNVTNLPPSRIGALGWSDSHNHFYLMGGAAVNSADRFSDLWKYKPAEREWAFIKGSSALNVGGVYPPVNTSTPEAMPGARANSVTWTNFTTDRLYLFGGQGVPASGGLGTNALADLWSFDTTGLNWTFHKGMTGGNGSGVYVTKGVPSDNGYPSSRIGATGGGTIGGKGFIFGGNGRTYSHSFNAVNNEVWTYDASGNRFTWESGDYTTDVNGVHGAVNATHASYKPGARYGAASWSVGTSHMYLFGGTGYSFGTNGNGYLNDLWRYDVSTGLWAYVGGNNAGMQYGKYGPMGEFSTQSIPGGRHFAACTTDNQGRLWMYGGYGLGISGFGLLADLWCFDPNTNLWAFMGGSSDHRRVPSFTGDIYPGGLQYAHLWCDQGNNLWLFGGEGPMQTNGGWGTQNCMWKFNTGARTWEFLRGDQTLGPAGKYGTQTIPAQTNSIGGRSQAAYWKDSDGNFWVFGGYGTGKTMILGRLNDLWRYSPVANEWTWMKGADVIYQPSNFGEVPGRSEPQNVPSSRSGVAFWADRFGDFWIFGGEEYLSSTNTALTNEIWKYSRQKNEWVCLRGYEAKNQDGNYTQGQISMTPRPGARKHTAAGYFSNSGAYLHGGNGYGVRRLGLQNDLWHFLVYQNAEVEDHTLY